MLLLPPDDTLKRWRGRIKNLGNLARFYESRAIKWRMNWNRARMIHVEILCILIMHVRDTIYISRENF